MPKLLNICASLSGAAKASSKPVYSTDHRDFSLTSACISRVLHLKAGTTQAETETGGGD